MPQSKTLRRCALTLSAATLVSFFTPSYAMADPLPFFDTIPDGRDLFDTRVNNAGGTLFTDPLSGLANSTNSWVQTDYTITSTNAANRSVSTSALNGFGGALAGTPGGDAISMTADGTTGSGLTFTFNNPINGFGIDLEGWATCCFPSGLYLEFDSGTPIQVGEAASGADNPGIAAGQGATTFVGAIDDSGTFTTVTFYGLASGDVMNAGGIIRYAIVPLGSISGNYVQLVSNSGVSGLASYLDQNDESGDRQTLATFLNTASPAVVEQTIKTVFPVNTNVTSQSMMSSSSSTTTVLLDKVGTVLGKSTSNIGLGMMENGGFDSSAWIFGDQGSDVQGFQGQGDPLLALASSPFQKFETGERAVWFEGVGSYATGDATSNSLGYDTISRGFVGGYEYALTENRLMGIVVSGFYSDVEMDANAGETEAFNYNIGFYGQQLFDDVKMTVLLIGGYGSYDSERRVNSGGTQFTPQGEYNAYSIGGSIGFSRLYEHDEIQIEPFVQASYNQVLTEGYTETGGGSFNNVVEDDTFSSVGAKLGVNLQTSHEIDNKDLTFAAKPYVGHNWEIEEAKTETRFVDSSTSTTIDGRSLTTFNIGMAAEMRYEFSDSTTFKFGVDVSRDEYEDRALGFVGFGMTF